MKKPSFSLLTQKEIDTLISFLTDKKSGINSDVMNQDSIDKLIQLIKGNDLTKIRLDALDSLEIHPGDLLKELGIRENDDEPCELIFRINDDTKHIELYALNTVTSKEYPILPSTLDRMEYLHGKTTWGFCMAPIFFCNIARIFGLKFSKHTYDAVCELFLDKVYGTNTVKIPSLYCPSSDTLLDNLV